MCFNSNTYQLGSKFTTVIKVPHSIYSLLKRSWVITKWIDKHTSDNDILIAIIIKVIAKINGNTNKK